jgi:tripartite ATP-independent transporter DctP family solute receptor
MKTGMISLALAGLLMASQAMAQEARTLRLGMQGTAGDPQFEGVTEAARIIKEKSGGRLTLEIFPNSQLGTFTEMMEQVTLGELDFTLNPFGGMDAWVPRAVLASTAYVVGDFDHLQKIIASDWGKGIVDEMRAEHKWRMVDSWYFGTRHTTAKKPIEKPADFAGMKLRVPNSAPLLTWAKAMGASPTPVAFAEVYLALQTNQVDGQENPLPIIDSMKFTEVQSHVSLTGHLVQDQLILMSEDTWNALEPADQKVVMEAFEAGGALNDKLVTDKETNLVSDFRERGITVVEPDKSAFQEAMKPVYADLDAKFGADTVKTLLDLR